MELQIQDLRSGKSSGTVTVSDEAFGADFKEPLVHQVVTAFLAGQRLGTKAQKSRADVRGGGTKPWRQKGTGRARAGSIRSPIWRGGGRTFAAKPRDHSQKVNRKMYRAALRSILAELARQDRLVVAEGVELEQPKTKALTKLLAGLGLSDVLIVTEDADDRLMLASRNIPKVDVCETSDVNPVNLIAYDKVLMTVGALKRLEERLS